MNIIISGAQFNNKGAQAMLFTTMDQFRKHYGDVHFYYVPIDSYRKYDESVYKFEVVYGGTPAREYASDPSPLKKLLLLSKAAVRSAIKKDAAPPRDIRKLREVMSKADVLVDISGYNLSSKGKWTTNQRFLEMIELAIQHGLKTLLLPQSFGPFDYGAQQKSMDQRIPGTLSKVDLLFARETDGKRMLEEQYGLTNVKLSPDLVLQSDKIDWRNVTNEAPELHFPKLTTTGNVGIIPNAQTFRHGSTEQILTIYERIIRNLLEKGRNVYIFCHSKDLEVCQLIYAKFASTPNVFLIEDEFECWDYCEFIQQFDFLIASRYHSIVHAYREGIPALILGWAVKYKELAERFKQSDYIFDITVNCEMDALLSALDQLNSSYERESEQITETLNRLQGNRCFDACWALLDGESGEGGARSI